MCAMNYPNLKQSFLQVGGLLISLCLPCHYQPDWAAGHHDFLCLFLLGVCSPLKDEIPKAVLESETKYKESEEMYECRRYFSMPCYKCCSGPVGYTMVSCFTRLSGHWSASDTVLFRMVYWSTTVVWSELPLKGAVATKWIWQWPDEHRCRDSLGFWEHTGGKVLPWHLLVLKVGLQNLVTLFHWGLCVHPSASLLIRSGSKQSIG